MTVKRKNNAFKQRNMGIEYYSNTIEKNDVVEVINIDDFINLVEDKKERTKLNIIKQTVLPNNCYSNTLFACDMCNGFEYIEGVIKNKYNWLIHHAWVYSNRYNVYVDLTLPNIEDRYYISNHLTLKETKAFIESCIEYDEEEEDEIMIPRFYNNNVPLFWKD